MQIKTKQLKRIKKYLSERKWIETTIIYDEVAKIYETVTLEQIKIELKARKGCK